VVNLIECEGGLIIGGERGKRLVYEKGKPIGEATLTEVNIGGPGRRGTLLPSDLLGDSRRPQPFKGNKCKRAAEASTAAAAEGAAKSAKYQQGSKGSRSSLFPGGG